MLTTTGQDLDILIITEANQEWQTFATWYSFYKNVPDARIIIACVRNQETPYQYFQWCHRLQIPVLYQNPAIKELSQLCALLESSTSLGPLVLLVPPLTMAIDTLSPTMVEEINNRESLFWPDEDVWISKNFKQEAIAELLNRCALDEIKINNMKAPFPLIKEANETTELWPLVSYRKGCGKWINTLRGCPLSNAEGLISEEMTVNENRIIELWKKMVSLYSAVAY